MVTYPLTPSILNHVTAATVTCMRVCSYRAETRMHWANDPKCSELGLVCFSLSVETYGNWGRVAQSTFFYLASHLAIITSSHKYKVLTEIYSSLNFILIRAPYWLDVHPPLASSKI